MLPLSGVGVVRARAATIDVVPAEAPAIRLAPIVRINLRADDDVAHGLRDRAASEFRWRFPAGDRFRKAGGTAVVFTPRLLSMQQLREIQLDLQLRFRNGFEIRVREGVIADFVALLRIRVSRCCGY